MISDLDLGRAANILVKRYGADAPIIAAQRADDMLAFRSPKYDVPSLVEPV